MSRNFTSVPQSEFVLRIIFPILVSSSWSSYSFLSISPCPVSVARRPGHVRNEKRTLFPSGEKELDLDQHWVRRTSLLYTPNHLSFKGMFMFAHFSLLIVLKETELMRMLLGKCLHILQSLSSSCNLGWNAQFQFPTFLMPIFRSESGTKSAAQTSLSVRHWSRQDCGTTEMKKKKNWNSI